MAGVWWGHESPVSTRIGAGHTLTDAGAYRLGAGAYVYRQRPYAHRRRSAESPVRPRRWRRASLLLGWLPVRTGCRPARLPPQPLRDHAAGGLHIRGCPGLGLPWRSDAGRGDPLEPRTARPGF